MNPTQIIATAAITALVTTLVTQGVSAIVRAVGKRHARSKEPAMLRRRGMQWNIVNQTSRVMLDVSVNVTHPEFANQPMTSGAVLQPGVVPANQKQPYVYATLGSIYGKAVGYVSAELHAGDVVSIGWSSIGRLTQKPKYYNVELNMKQDVDEYALSAEPMTAGNA